jgi:hypothetical protein
MGIDLSEVTFDFYWVNSQKLASFAALISSPFLMNRKKAHLHPPKANELLRSTTVNLF